uniref:Uncharacterized protein n=1 Tax=Panagrolaimus sp. PS1159 TaxID=55785 RepID=A0AC35FR63_9BILA
MPGAGFGGGASGRNSDDLINGASTYTLAQQENLNNAPAFEKIPQQENLNNAPAFEKIRENDSLADTVAPRELLDPQSGLESEENLTVKQLTELGVGVMSERLAVLPSSNFHG